MRAYSKDNERSKSVGKVQHIEAHSWDGRSELAFFSSTNDEQPHLNALINPAWPMAKSESMSQDDNVL